VDELVAEHAVEERQVRRGQLLGLVDEHDHRRLRGTCIERASGIEAVEDVRAARAKFRGHPIEQRGLPRAAGPGDARDDAVGSSEDHPDEMLGVGPAGDGGRDGVDAR
jgi:hypothetical protein